MKVPISWLRDFVNLDGLAVAEIARKLTLSGLEVSGITYVGLALPSMVAGEPHEFKTTGIAWDRERIVVGEVRAVLPHPNADRLTLLDLYDGRAQHTVLTGAPNIFHLRGKGILPKPLKVAYAKEGATLYDGHAEGLHLTTLKRTKIRGVESDSMVCSEKELGISEDHEGIILLDERAPSGMPLADYMGDAVLDIDIMPNMARNASVIGVARELAALTGRRLIKPNLQYKSTGESVKKSVTVEITEPELNPRFVLGLIRNVQIRASPYEVQRRLKLAGMRPINCIVDATNYAMLELGQPLHAFDYDALQERAGKTGIKIITRRAMDGETLTTLDGTPRRLTPLNVLVCDERGPLSIAGVMGGAETEVVEAALEPLDLRGIETKTGELVQGKASASGTSTVNVLLEGAAWHFISIRRTAQQHNLPSEASFRFSRGVHPALALSGVQRGLQYMAEWSGGIIAPGLVDEYPRKPKVAAVTIRSTDVKRLLGIELSSDEIVRLLTSLEFKCEMHAKPAAKRSGRQSKARRARTAAPPEASIRVTAPPHRLDIGTGIIGVSDVVEEIARLVGYDRIPSTNMSDALPPQIGNPLHEWEEDLRDTLVALGFDEVVSYRLTSPESEARLGITAEHVRIANPIAPEKNVLRRSLLASVLEDLERNIRRSDSLAMFEIGPVFEPRGGELPVEPLRLAMVMSGRRQPAAWDAPDAGTFDFYDLKGRLELFFKSLGLSNVSFTPVDAIPYLHPGKAAEIQVDGRTIGAIGELHPSAAQQYDFRQRAVLAAELDLDSLRKIAIGYQIRPVPDFPPVLEDIAIVVDDAVPAARIDAAIRRAGGSELADARLFDIYRGDQIGAGKKSLAYSLTYQAPDRTLTDGEAAAIRNRVVKQLEQELGAKLRQ